MQVKGQILKYEASTGKVFGMEMQQRLANVAINLLDSYGQLQRGARWTP